MLEKIVNHGPEKQIIFQMTCLWIKFISNNFYEQTL